MENESEQEIRAIYEASGYDVIHIGVPDFILLKNGHIEFVEVKTKNSKLSDEQKKVIRLLRKHKFPVRIEGTGGQLPPEAYEIDPKEVPKPAFLTSREWVYILALKKYNGARAFAARDLSVTVHAIENKLTHIRKKMESAYAFKRKYGTLIKRLR